MNTRLDGQVIRGGVVSRRVTVWLHSATCPHALVACQARVMTVGQTPLVTVCSTRIATLLSQHEARTVGSLKLHDEPHSTTRLLAHCSVRHGPVEQGMKKNADSPTASTGATGSQAPSTNA